MGWEVCVRCRGDDQYHVYLAGSIAVSEGSGALVAIESFEQSRVSRERLLPCQTLVLIVP